MAFHPIIDPAVRSLVADLDAATSPVQRDVLLLDLVRTLTDRCARPEVRAAYDAYRDGAAAPAFPSTYPLDGDGFALSFDPLEEEEAFRECWTRHGVVVGRGVASAGARRAAVGRMREVALAASGGAADLLDPATYGSIPADAAGIPLVSRGFFELYHDRVLADLRQEVRLYLHHVLIWGRADLWTTFDRLGAKLPGHGEGGALPLHVDQNPLVHPGFRTVQGVLALDDCPAERGTFAVVPGSRCRFHGYLRMAGRGEHVELRRDDPLHAEMEARVQTLPLRGGDVVSWDARTTHANTANLSGEARWVAYVAAGPAREDDPEAVAARAEAFRTGLGSNVRDALMHASKKPRHTAPEAMAAVRAPERLTALGRLLYGLDRHADAPRRRSLLAGNTGAA